MDKHKDKMETFIRQEFKKRECKRFEEEKPGSTETFSAINKKADKVCKMQRYGIMYEYSNYHALPPPLSAVYLFMYFLRYIKRCKDCRLKDAGNHNDEESFTMSNRDTVQNRPNDHRQNKPARKKARAFGKNIEKHCYKWEQKMRKKYDEGNRQKDIVLVATNPDQSETNNRKCHETVRLVLRSAEAHEHEPQPQMNTTRTSRNVSYQQTVQSRKFQYFETNRTDLSRQMGYSNFSYY